MKFTDEQLRAVEAPRELPSVVSAAAGSGKTTVLISRVLRLITMENPVSADRLAIVTFTEKAAAELMSRLESRMDELVSENPENELYARQRIRLKDARVSTISSFCLSLLRENTELLPYDGDFAVCDETEAKLIRAEAMNALYKDICDFSPEKRREINKLIGGKNEIFSVVGGIYDFLTALPDREGFLAQQTAIFADPALYKKTYVDPLAEKAASLAGGADKILAAAFDELCASDGKYETALSAYIADYRAFALSVKTAFETENLAALPGLSAGGGLRLPGAKGDDKEKGEQMTKLRDEAKALLEQSLSFAETLSSAESDRETCGREIAILEELCGLFAEKYAKLKTARNCVDFSDLEATLLALLKSPAGQRKNLGSGFGYIIVDEFQDSNDVQYEIFRLLSDGEKNLYFVGDVKQCIYGFRGANPFVFASLIGKYNTLLINGNFRSSDSVIESVNRLFGGAQLPAAFSGGDWQPMEAKRGVVATGENKTELVRVDYSADEDGTAAEAQYVAARIRKMLDDGFPVTRKDGSVSPCRVGDFTILLRSDSGRIKIFSDALAAAGIPSVSKGGRNFTDLTEIDLAVSLLKVISNPYDNAALAGIMMSPLFCFSAEEMARIRLKSRADKSFDEDLFGAALKLSSGEAALSRKLAGLVSKIRLWRKISADISLSGLIRYIFSETDLLAVERAGYKGDERVGNLRLLESYAETFEKSGGDLSGFIIYIESVRRQKLEMPQAVPAESDAASVKIMTMHASKGLQFPVVFICCTNSRPDKRDSSQPFVFDITSGIGAMVNDFDKPARFDTAPHKLVNAVCAEKRAGEELRLLYVAMTRAEEKLIITAANGCSGKKPPTAVPLDFSASAGSHCDFIKTALCRIPDRGAFIGVSIAEAAAQEIFKPSCTENAAEAVDEAKIERNLAFVYPYQKQTEIPAKLTATQLGVAREESDKTEESTAFYMGLPLFMKNRKRVTPKERGDIYHKAMEYLDFSAAHAGAELERLVSDGTMTADEVKIIDSRAVQAFLDSPLGRRAAKSGEVHREFPIFTLVNAGGLPDPQDEDLSFVQGIADMFFVENGEIVLVDYKTNVNITEKSLSDEYRGQLCIYKKALTEMTGKKVAACYLFSFSLGQEIPVETDGFLSL